MPALKITPDSIRLSAGTRIHAPAMSRLSYCKSQDLGMKFAEGKKKNQQNALGGLRCICLPVQQWGSYCSFCTVFPLNSESRCASQEFWAICSQSDCQVEGSFLQNQNSPCNDFSSPANFSFFSEINFQILDVLVRCHADYSSCGP